MNRYDITDTGNFLDTWLIYYVTLDVYIMYIICKCRVLFTTVYIQNIALTYDCTIIYVVYQVLNIVDS